MRIGIAADHGGVELKKMLIDVLTTRGDTVTNYGTDSTEAVDYPDYAFSVGEAIRDELIDYGILICKTGIGMSIAANKVEKVRCAKVSSVDEAGLCRKHNNANCLALSGDLDANLAKEIVLTFLLTPSLEEKRHQRRVAKMNDYRWQ